MFRHFTGMVYVQSGQHYKLCKAQKCLVRLEDSEILAVKLYEVSNEHVQTAVFQRLTTWPNLDGFSVTTKGTFLTTTSFHQTSSPCSRA